MELAHADATMSPDVPNVVTAPTGRCIGYATMSDIGGEWDGGTDGMPTLLLDGGVSSWRPARPTQGRWSSSTRSDRDALTSSRCTPATRRLDR